MYFWIRQENKHFYWYSDYFIISSHEFTTLYFYRNRYCNRNNCSLNYTKQKLRNTYKHLCGYFGFYRRSMGYRTDTLLIRRRQIYIFADRLGTPIHCYCMGNGTAATQGISQEKRLEQDKYHTSLEWDTCSVFYFEKRSLYTFFSIPLYNKRSQ